MLALACLETKGLAPDDVRGTSWPDALPTLVDSSLHGLYFISCSCWEWGRLYFLYGAPFQGPRACRVKTHSLLPRFCPLSKEAAYIPNLYQLQLEVEIWSIGQFIKYFILYLYMCIMYLDPAHPPFSAIQSPPFSSQLHTLFSFLKSTESAWCSLYAHGYRAIYWSMGSPFMAHIPEEK